MIDWTALTSEYDQINQQLTDAHLEQRTRATLQKRASQLSKLLELNKGIVALGQEITDLDRTIQTLDGELKDMYQEEILSKKSELKSLQDELEDTLYPADPMDDKSVFIEIRAGAGGQESALFAADMYRMYSNYALSKNWAVSVTEDTTTDLGGFKEIIIHIQGKKVFKSLKFESGVHRVQRVPKTETQGRVHTSTITVAVMPELDDVEITVNPADIKVDTYRAGGAGGQHVNKTDSAVRMTHIPTGIVVACQDERSQIKNRQKALKILQARIFAAEKERQEAALSAERKQQVGSGERAEKIRTYNFPQNRVTDHRTDLTLKKLDMVMEGDMDDLILPLIDWERQQRRQNTKV